MIDRVLDKGFVLRQAELIRDELGRRVREEAVDDGGAAEHARAELAKALRREDDGLEEVQADETDLVWVPRDRTLSILQTVMEERIRKNHARLLVDAEGPLTTKLVDEGDLESPGDFTHGDPGWVSGNAAAIAWRLWRGKHAFVRTTTPPDEPLASHARVILMSDWGTGGPAAQSVAAIAREQIESAGDREIHVIHMGDVYYSGEEWESQTRFLQWWPVKKGEEGKYRSWCIMGNHDMYAGGYGFFEVILEDKRFARQRTDGKGISYFGLSNDDWAVLGLDTAWDDHLITHQGHDGFLEDPQGEWVATTVRTGREAGAHRRTMLLSHHQFYTTHGGGDDHTHVKGNLASKLKKAFQAGGIDAWFWGHEHRCQTFARRDEVRYSACIGHAAMPEKVGGGHPETGEWEFDQGGEKWRYCGLAVLDFDGADVAVRYINEHVGEFKSETLPVD